MPRYSISTAGIIQTTKTPTQTVHQVWLSDAVAAAGTIPKLCECGIAYLLWKERSMGIFC